jgi:hypothetical protein
LPIVASAYGALIVVQWFSDTNADIVTQKHTGFDFLIISTVPLWKNVLLYV